MRPLHAREPPSPRRHWKVACRVESFLPSTGTRVPTPGSDRFWSVTEGEARVVVGRYRLVRPLGRGGMGAVWQAQDTLLHRTVAIKEIWLPTTGDGPVDPADPLVRRAIREARAAARLRHPGIVTIHDVVSDNGRPWIIMELIGGRSLAEAIGEHGLLTEQRTAQIGLDVLDALQAAHREGISHRDVKPANILLGADRAVLTDFGIAALEDASTLTVTGQLVGSPAYLAPERINGRPATPAADLWALGVTLYTALTGVSPFQRGDTQATLAAILHSKPNPPAHAGRLWPVIKGLLDKDPAGRLTAEKARALLATVASVDLPPRELARRSGWWSGGARRRSDPDGTRQTLAAPPATIAAPTAHQDPLGETVPIADRIDSGTVTVDAALRPESRRSRRVWVAGLVAGTLILAGATLAIVRPWLGDDHNKNAITPSDPLSYICTETRLTIYGNKNASTDSYQRVSRTP